MDVEVAEKIRHAVASLLRRGPGPSKAALEGERKQVTVLFADLKGSMELLDRVVEDLDFFRPAG